MSNKLPFIIGLFVLLLDPTVVQAQTKNQQFTSNNSSSSLNYNSNFTKFKIPKQSNFDEAKDFSVTNQFNLNSILLSKSPNQPASSQNFLTIAQLPTKKATTTPKENTAKPITLAEADFVKYQTTSESLDSVITPDNSLTQVTDVSQLRDVQAGDWAYEALRGLVERYGCIAGYPNQTYRGTQALSRYEFAAGLNSCLQQIERLIASSEAVAQEDLATIKRLTQEFEAELAAIGGRVDDLESRTAFLEDHQFSTTTILNGEVIFAVADAFGGDPPGGCSLPADTATPDGRNIGADCVNRGEPETNTVFTHLTRLGLQTSFTGQDRLRMYLTTGNFSDGGFTNVESLNTYMARLGYQADYDNDIYLDIVEYRLPAFDDKVVFYASTFGFALSNVLTANSPYFDIGRGAVSRFGQLNPILRIGGAMDAGVGFDWAIAEPLRFQVAYGTRDSGDPEAGFFGSDYSALGAQFLVQPTDNIVAGINYVNAYSSDGSLGTFTGSVNAETGGLWSGASVPAPEEATNSPFAACCRFLLGDQPAQINAVGGSFQWNVTEKLNFAAWGGYTFANFLNELPDFPETEVDGTPPEDGIGASANKKPFANTATFTLSLGLSDPFGREGDLFGFIFGMPPKLVDAGPETAGTPVPFFEQVINNEGETVVTDNNPNLDTVGEVIAAGGDAPGLVNSGQLPRRVGQKDEATSLHFEFFYRFKVNDSISITPGFYFVTNPGHIENNDTIYVGTIRTTYRF
ncbi:cyanobacterial porin [Stanieria cyanosphaera PCC 7437]|uniref:Cyanobacterial porin n=1 Tax=Stanieria cyanosphaera (strain ATCC 29371 / PCC 7437) TaxID=111780 RepID=K9XYR3_STAC7|nr:iron uptake porin [Stanieria cyanosphaera]AFZ37169.1 cyanobacterial porin [Stanieria cyanosphaera PCC 7437]